MLNTLGTKLCTNHFIVIAVVFFVMALNEYFVDTTRMTLGI